MSEPDGIVRQTVQDVLGIEVRNDDLDLITTGVLDSLGLVNLVVELEQRLGIELPFAELDVEHFRSLRSLRRLVDSSLGVA